ncbi:CYTH domain-containing protein, partial [Thiolapillus sp.]
MGIEIERKFLLASDAWRNDVEKSLNMRQGYLSHDALSSVRIRVYGDHADINVKSTRDGIHRLEYEYPIPLPDAQELLSRVAHRPLIEKTRHVLHQACLRPRDRFWDIPVPKIDSAFDNPLVPQPSWSPSTTQQLRKLVAAPYLAPNDWTPRSEAYFVFPLAQGTPGKQCGLAATGVYQPSLRSPWLAVVEGHCWEIDEFEGENAGLIVAEIELDSVDEVFHRPAWLGE